MIDAIASQLGGIPREGVVALIVLVALQLCLQVVALIDLARRPLVNGGKKWVWAVAIIAGNLVGAVAYLAIGRRPGVEEADPGRTGNVAGNAHRDALDGLYGPKSGKETG